MNVHARKIYEHIGAVDLSCRCYERTIQESVRPKTKCDNMVMYVDYLESKGKKCEAIRVQEQMVTLLNYNSTRLR